MPAAHLVQPPTLPTPQAPALQTQSVLLLLACGAAAFSGQPRQVALDTAPSSVENFPEVHSSHTASPGAVLYVPAAHSEHCRPSDPVDPAGQMQSVLLLLPAGAMA